MLNTFANVDEHRVKTPTRRSLCVFNNLLKELRISAMKIMTRKNV